MGGTKNLLSARSRKTALLTATISLAAMIAAMPEAASAQTTTPPPPPADDGAAIVVTGIKYGIATSIRTKRDSLGIVEAVSAEEIGKLPDVSIAESLARLPGLAGQRINGRAQVISIRGLSPDFTTTLLNGRQQASSGDNRAVEFDQYPSELLSSVVVYKTPDASVAGMGLSGTADMRTLRPLETGHRVITYNVRGQVLGGSQLNADVRKWGDRISASYVDQNADGTLGWAIGFAHLDSPSQNRHYKAYGYESFGAVGGAVSPASAQNALQLNGEEIFASSRSNIRNSAMGVLEWRPSDRVHATMDLYYSRFKQREVMRGAQWFSNAWADGATFTNEQTTTVGGSQVATSGTFNKVVPILRNDYNTRDDELIAGGLNAEFAMTDRLKFIADLSYSSNKRDESLVETYGGYGVGPAVSRTNFDRYDFNLPMGSGFPSYTGFGLNYADASRVSLGDRAPWGGWGHDGLMKSPHVKETVYAIDGNLEYSTDGFFDRFLAGFNFTHTDKNKTVDELDMFLKNNRAQTLVAQPYLVSPTSLSFAGFGNVLSVNLPAAMNTYYNFTPLANTDHFDKAWGLTEEIMTWKLQGVIGSGRLHGNVGVQIVQQMQKSSGLRINNTVSPMQLTPVNVSTSYTDVLPSLNLYYDLGGGHRLRFAAAQVMARPRMDDMRANLVPSFNGAVCTGSQACAPGSTVHPWSATGGNPALRPWRAFALDAAYEWYISKASYISIAAFYKKLDTYIYQRTGVVDFSGLPLPTTASSIPTNVTISPLGQITYADNGKGGWLRGLEISGALEFGKVTRLLDGFGVIGSLSLTDSNLNPTDATTPNSQIRIPGLSGTVYNVTGYYEKSGFQARASYRYRSAFKGEVPQLFATRGFTEILADRQVDAQIGYTFQPGSSLSGLGILLQVNNLTDSPYRTRLGLDGGGTKTSNGSTLPETYEKYGREFLFGFSYKF